MGSAGAAVSESAGGQGDEEDGRVRGDGVIGGDKTDTAIKEIKYH